jgi:plasmid replication initiation protein
MIAVEVKLSDWFYHSIIANELLTISREYFRLRKPIERRIYELARKHCGDQPTWKVRLEKLHKKIGSTAPLRKLRVPLVELAATNHLPDYNVALSSDDVVTFTNRRRTPQAGRQTSLPLLMTETYEKAKRAAPGCDVYFIERMWQEWSAGKVPPHNQDAAFLGFCKKVYRGKDKQ